MRKLSFVLATVLFCAVPALSQVEIILDEPCPTFNGGDIPAQFFHQDISILNPNDTVQFLCAIFTIRTSPDIEVLGTPSLDWQNEIDTLFDMINGDVWRVDSLVFVRIWLSSPTVWNGGIVPNEQPLQMATINVNFWPTEGSLSDGKVWIDSTDIDTTVFFWRYGSGSLEGSPTFSGPVEYHVYIVPNTVPILVQPYGTSTITSAGPGCTIGAWFHYEETYIGWDYDSIVCRVNSGPGEVVEVGYDQFRWEYTPAPEDAGQTFELYFGMDLALCGEVPSYYSFSTLTPNTVHVGPADTKPEFLHFQQTTYIASVGEPLEISFDLDDPDPEENQYYYYVSAQDPDPPATIDPETGVFTFLGTIDDTATYWVNEVVEGKCGAVADTIGFFVYLYSDPICGDANHNGNVDLSDLIWLTNYLFMGGVQPVPMLAGDINCDGNVDLSDLIGLVNYLFVAGPAPCANCP